MIEKLKELISLHKLNIYAIAEITEKGEKSIRLQPSNSCNNSYSVAKVFTATAIGMLQDDGLLNVKDLVFPIFQEAFPKNYDKKWEKVTIEHVIKHQVGFDRGFLDIDVENIYEYDTDDFLYIVLSHQLEFEPGTHCAYSDAAYYLLPRIITAKTGKKLDDFLQDRLFNPLEFQEVAWSKCPKGYPIGATGLYIRTQDMVKLGWVYLNAGMYNDKHIISEKWVKQALSCEYGLSRQGDQNAYTKGGMFNQMLYISLEPKIAIAWHGYNPEDINLLYNYLTSSVYNKR